MSCRIIIYIIIQKIPKSLKPWILLAIIYQASPISVACFTEKACQKFSEIPSRHQPNFLSRIPLDLNLHAGESNSAVTAIRMSFFEAVESALIGCRFCSLICQGLKTLGAQIAELPCIVTVPTGHGKPFYISWDNQPDKGLYQSCSVFWVTSGLVRYAIDICVCSTFY